MSAPPFMPLYVADYLGDTRHLTTEQHGAYLLLLMAMWRAGGRVPAEGEKLARIVGLTPAKWAKLEEDVLAFFRVEAGDLVHRRMEKELMRYTKTVEKRRDAGSRGGRAKSLKSNDTTLANATDLPEQKGKPGHSNQNQNQNQKEIIPTDRDNPDPSVDHSRRERSDPKGFAGFWTAYPRKVGKLKAQEAWAKALKSAAPEAILAGLERAKRNPKWAREPEFIPHPATWLNQGRWMDGEEPSSERPRRVGFV